MLRLCPAFPSHDFFFPTTKRAVTRYALLPANIHAVCSSTHMYRQSFGCCKGQICVLFVWDGSDKEWNSH